MKTTESKRGRGRPSMKHLKCKVRGCKKQHRSKGFCANHYQKHKRKHKKESQCEDFMIDVIDMGFQTDCATFSSSQPLEATMGKQDNTEEKPTRQHCKWTPKEERTLLVAMDKVDKLPTIDGKERKKRDSSYWNEVSTVMRLDSKGFYSRGGYALEVRYGKMMRRKAKENFEEGAKASPTFSDNWSKLGAEVAQIRIDISQTYEKVTSTEHSVARLEEEVARMRGSVQSIEEMIEIVFRSYGLKKGGE